MWHEGGFETRPYKRPDCAMLPVLGLRERLRQREHSTRAPHAGRPKAVPPRPKAVIATPKRTPKPRHVWLSDAAPTGAARSADIITLRPETVSGSTSRDQANTLLARLLATQIAAAA